MVALQDDERRRIEAGLDSLVDEFDDVATPGQIHEAGRQIADALAAQRPG